MSSRKLSIICVITARGGSKGLPGKNTIPLNDRPLIAYSIDAAIHSKHIDTTVVSTDYEDIRAISLECGAEAPFIRPHELATDTAHSPDVVEHAVSYYETVMGRSYDITVMLQPTSPFRNHQHIDEAIDEFLKDDTLDSLISIKKQDYPPWWMFKLDDKRLTPAFDYQEGVNVFDLERQQFPSLYRPNGAIYVTWRDYLKRTGSIVNPKNNGFYIMEERDSIDIDTQSDLYAAEAECLKRQI